MQKVKMPYSRSKIMKVKIGEKIYDAEYQPIMIILSDNDKLNISNMKHQTKYCAYPTDLCSKEEVERFMETPAEEPE